MNQVTDILNLAKLAQQQNVDAVLATVVRTEGSAYRQAGAMMLICADGRSVGMISGGCLEPHIIKRAFWLTRDGASVQVYQTGDEQKDYGNVEFDIDSDDELNFGLGCNGKVHVLFERLTSAQPFLELIKQVRKNLQTVTLATLIGSDKVQSQNAQLQIGMRININAYRDTGQVTSPDSKQDFSDCSTFISIVKKLSVHKLSKRNTAYIVVKNDLADEIANGFKQQSGQTEWLIQRICPQKRLLICGAGNDVMPLVVMAKMQDWHVTVIDSRAQYSTHTRFPQADAVMCLALEDSETLSELSECAAVAVMSHSLSQDRARLAILFANPNFSYLGQLGPRYRTERLIEEISASKANPASLAKGIAKLHYPIGYKLGGDGPEALALSIMAQISSVMNNQTQSVNTLDSNLEKKSTSQAPAQVNSESLYKSNFAKSYELCP